MELQLEDPSPSEVSTLEEAHAVIDELIQQLKVKLPQRCGLRVSEIVRAGSVGLGLALPSRFDVDLVVYSPDLEAHAVVQHGYRGWLGRINVFLQEDPELKDFYSFHNLTRQALQFSVEGIEVELLLSPHWARPGDLYGFLHTTKPQNRDKFLCSAAKWQVIFFKQQPSLTKDFRREFIKRARAWRDQKWPLCTGGKGRPSSYLLSLLVIRCYEDCHKRLGAFSSLSPDTLAWQTTEELKSMVYNHKTIDIYWEQCYSLRQYPSLVAPRPPRILDPANPANNLYFSGVGHYGSYEWRGEYDPGDGDWSVFVRNVQTLDLSKPVGHWV